MRFCTFRNFIFIVASLTKGSNHDREDRHERMPSPPREGKWDKVEETTEYWQEKTRNTIYDNIASAPNMQRAKNTVLLIGDGMGITTMTAGRILLNGEAHMTEMDSLEYSSLIKTYNVDYQTPDSAATATAYLTGIKGRYGTVGVNAGVERGSCGNLKGNEIESVLEKAKRAGKSVGIVTNTYIVHASPSAAFAKTPDRYWYDDAEMAADYTEYENEKDWCKDIATQFHEHRHSIDVVLAGGRRYFYPEPPSEVDKEEEHEEGGHRLDGNNYIEEWKAQDNLTYIETRDDLLAYQDDGKNLIGLFALGHLEYDLDRPDDQPTLTEMTEVAVKKLQKNPNGFYLFVEGGQIDFGHHGNEAIAALYEFKALDKAVGKVKSLTSSEDTLVMVSADHGHVFSIGAYGERGSDVFGTGKKSSTRQRWDRNGTDEENTMILGYANGPGYRSHFVDHPTDPEMSRCGREVPSETEKERSDPEKHSMLTWPSTVPLKSESHSAEDVALMASGPWAHLVRGVQEQTIVATLGEFAMCIGDYQNEAHCTEPRDTGGELSLAIHFVCFVLSLLLI